MRFRSELQLAGKTATGFVVPAAVVDEMGHGKKPPVRITVQGHTYRTSVATREDRFMISVSAEIRQITGLRAGDEVDVDIEFDPEPRSVDVPADLAAALDRQPAARRSFDALAYSHQLRHVLAVQAAKAPETRQRRIDGAIAMLLETPPKKS